jgi:hypothetical protein
MKMKKRTQLLSTIGMLTLLSVALMGTADASSGMGHGRGENRGARHNDPIHQAIESGDYQAFLSAKQKVGYGIATMDFTEAQFKRLIEAHTLREQGKVAEAEKIMKELGIQKPPREMNMKGYKAFEATLTDAQRKAFDDARELRRAGKRDEAQKIIDTAGIVMKK